MLSDEQIEANVSGIRATLEDLLSDRNGTGPAPVILNNLVHGPFRMRHPCSTCMREAVVLCMRSHESGMACFGMCSPARCCMLCGQSAAHSFPTLLLLGNGTCRDPERLAQRWTFAAGLVQGREPARIPARRGQARARGHDAVAGERALAHGGRQRGHVLH